MEPTRTYKGLIAAFAAGWALWLAQTLVAGDTQWLWLHSAQLGVALALLLMTRFRSFRVLSQVLAVAFPVLLFALYVAVRMGYFLELGFYSGSRAYLWYENPNPLAGSLVMACAVASVAVGRRRWLAGLLLVVGMLGAVTAQVRGALIGAILSAIAWVWTRFSGMARIWVAVASVAVVVGVGGFLATYDPPGPRGPVIGASELERLDPRALLGNASAGGGGSRARVHAFETGIRFFLSSPIAGVGVDGFAETYRSTIAPESRHPLANAHNLPIHLLATGGLLGFLGWAIPVGTALWAVRRRTRFLAPVLVAALWLNSIEVAFFWSGGFYGFWLALGWALHLQEASGDGDVAGSLSEPLSPEAHPA